MNYLISIVSIRSVASCNHPILSAGMGMFRVALKKENHETFVISNHKHYF